MPTVTVGCKLPHGLELRLFRMEKVQHPVMGGGFREVEEAREIGGKRVVINGWSHPQNAAPRAQMAHGTALTMGVDKEFFDKWMEQNREHAAVKNGLIFCAEKDGNVFAEAKAKEKVRSGLERLDPDHLPKGVKKAEPVAA